MTKTGIQLTARLLDNINTSLELRSRIPYLDTLRDLIEGGVSPTTAMMNTSSNFGSFDTHLRIVLGLLNAENSLISNPATLSPLPLSSILLNLTSNIELLVELLQDAADSNKGAEIVASLEQINCASV